jgi:hypothetical protein
MEASACAQVIESTNVSLLAIQIFGNSSSATGSSGHKLFTDNYRFLGSVGVIGFICAMISILGFWLVMQDLRRKKSRPHSSHPLQLPRPRRTTTVELESNGREPVKLGNQSPEGSYLRAQID